ncbi:hypothetical protein SNE40_008849 [Patella caerulea]|uniref:Uncharacterized protein n=1 Tax=Patella caerulea TaxID=87958 RepID=A0AAN8JUA3_PATCE
MALPSECSVTSRVVFSVVGLLVGLSVFVTFGFKYDNWNTSLWGLLSGLAASISIYVHTAYLRQVFQSNPFVLQHFMLTGCLIQLVGCCGFVTYLVLAITKNQGLVIIGPGYYLTCVWCFMTWKWGFFLLIYARKYKRVYVSECEVLTEHAEPGAKYYSA